MSDEKRKEEIKAKIGSKSDFNKLAMDDLEAVSGGNWFTTCGVCGGELEWSWDGVRCGKCEREATWI